MVHIWRNQDQGMNKSPMVFYAIQFELNLVREIYGQQWLERTVKILRHRDVKDH